MNSSTRASGLDGLRGLAAAAVVLLHVWMFSGAHQAWQDPRTDRILGTFGLAVMMFFVLSGFLLARPWVRASATGTPRPNLARYALRRGARILPAYLLCVGGSFVLMRAIDHPLAIEARELPAFLLFAQNQVSATSGQLNPPLWSLGIEMSFYLALPLVGLAMIAAWRRARVSGAIALVVATAALGLGWAAFAYGQGSPPALVNALPTYLPVFACGIAAAILVEGRTISRPWRGALLLAGAALVVADAWWHASPTTAAGHIVRDLPAAAGFALIAAAVVRGPAWFLGSPPLRRVGEYSYGIYLWHMPVLYLVRDQGHWPESPWQAYAMVLGGATALGALSWHLVERPLIAWAGRRAAPSRALPEAPALAPPRTQPTPASTHPAHGMRVHASHGPSAARAADGRGPRPHVSGGGGARWKRPLFVVRHAARARR